MASLGSGVRRGLLICLAIGSIFVGIFAIALLVAAFSGHGAAGSIFLGGLGFILLFLGVSGSVYAILHVKLVKDERKPGSE